jgi:hypothetical protein
MLHFFQRYHHLISSEQLRSVVRVYDHKGKRLTWYTLQLIQQAYAPQQSQASSDDHRRLQQELFDIQKHPEAWGLVIPFLNNPDPNVQFFGAHTAQVKIARDW